MECSHFVEESRLLSTWQLPTLFYQTLQANPVKYFYEPVKHSIIVGSISGKFKKKCFKIFIASVDSQDQKNNRILHYLKDTNRTQTFRAEITHRETILDNAMK